MQGAYAVFGRGEIGWPALDGDLDAAYPLDPELVHKTHAAMCADIVATFDGAGWPHAPNNSPFSASGVPIENVATLGEKHVRSAQVAVATLTEAAAAKPPKERDVADRYLLARANRLSRHEMPAAAYDAVSHWRGHPGSVYSHYLDSRMRFYEALSEGIMPMECEGTPALERLLGVFTAEGLAELGTAPHARSQRLEMAAAMLVQATANVVDFDPLRASGFVLYSSLIEYIVLNRQRESASSISVMAALENTVRSLTIQAVRGGYA